MPFAGPAGPLDDASVRIAYTMADVKSEWTMETTAGTNQNPSPAGASMNNDHTSEQDHHSAYSYFSYPSAVENDVSFTAPDVTTGATTTSWATEPDHHVPSAPRSSHVAEADPEGYALIPLGANQAVSSRKTTRRARTRPLFYRVDPIHLPMMSGRGLERRSGSAVLSSSVDMDEEHGADGSAMAAAGGSEAHGADAQIHQHPHSGGSASTSGVAISTADAAGDSSMNDETSETAENAEDDCDDVANEDPNDAASEDAMDNGSDVDAGNEEEDEVDDEDQNDDNENLDESVDDENADESADDENEDDSDDDDPSQGEDEEGQDTDAPSVSADSAGPVPLRQRGAHHLSLGEPNEPGEVDAQMVRNGHDVQGIVWSQLQVSREDYRATRLRERPQDATEALDSLRSVVKRAAKDAKFFSFSRNTRKVQCSIVHFQLRNLVWATSCHDVFLMHDASILHWDAAARRRTRVLDLTGNNDGADGIAASGQSPQLGFVQVSTMIAKDDLVIAGGFYGEVVAKNLRTHVIEYNKRITYDENAITNAIDIYDGGRVMTSNNDCYVRVFDLPSFEKVNEFRFTKAVNHATRQPHGKMVAVVGDDKPVSVMDGESGERIATLHGHEDFSFATGWHCDGRLFATGSQDNTCRVWDVRNMSQSVAVLGARVGAVRSLRFSSCGRFLALAESKDFVHVYDVARGDFGVSQEIDLFGEIAGISFSPDARCLYIGMFERMYGSLLEYERSSSSTWGVQQALL